MEDDFSHAEAELDEIESLYAEEAKASDDLGSPVIKQEIRHMNIIRTFLFAIMITFSTIASQIVYVVVRISEENNFKSGFQDLANGVIDGFYHELQVAVTTAESLSQTLTLQAHAQKASWPYVTFESFDTLCAGPKKLTGASAITLSPLIFSAMQQSAWERYAVYMEKSQFEFSNPDLESELYDEDEPAPAHDNTTTFYYDCNRTLDQGIYYLVDGLAVDHKVEDGEEGSSYPIWQQSPFPRGQDFRLFDQVSNPARAQALMALQLQKQGAMADFLLRGSNGSDYVYYPSPNTALYYPIFATTDIKLDLVGALNFNFPWESLLQQTLAEGTDGIVIVVQSSCGREYSFGVNDATVTYMGEGAIIPDADDDDFNAPQAVNSTYEAFAEILQPNPPPTANAASISCQYRLRMYASRALLNSYLSYDPDMYQAIVLAVFLFTIGTFIVYDCALERGSNKVVENAKRTDALINTLFPAQVKNRLLEDADRKKRQAKKQQQVEGSPIIQSPKLMLQNWLSPLDSILSNSSGSQKRMRVASDTHDNEPIADLFPDSSVMFADIAGFTAWSSEREPTQVFKLLETLYRSMDAAARKLRVFKVETIGDCYVAATGLPEQREDHLEALARFAKLSLFRTSSLTRDLEATLGPGTGELALRFGIHSGPVTAGVLRGEKARFQLFGDTMNFAARMESTGIKNRVHLSSASAELLMRRGKGHWVVPREDTVYAKGKGELQTFWLRLGAASNSIASIDSRSQSSARHILDNSSTKRPLLQPICETERTEAEPNQVLAGVIRITNTGQSTQRLVEWNTGALSLLLKKVVAYRKDGATPEEEPVKSEGKDGTRSFMNEIDNMVIPLPDYDEEAVTRFHEEDADLPHAVKTQLKLFVTAISSGYNKKNAFHNFEHASHVLLSATKLLKRISYADGHHKKEGVTTHDLHQYTCGISSDPLTQFAVVFAALIHDVGHTGVSNMKMAEELPEIAALYEHKSIAEQRSVDVALELLNLPKYKNLRKCICSTESERIRFRQLLLHCVLATDIFEAELKARRNQRWAQAFPGNEPDAESALSTKEDMNRKATIVLEHIIQASDVSHTMQHWHVYIKWNERLFQEMYTAYRSGRSENDPTEEWYKGELWFFDHYVIPLAKKLKECGMFGVSSAEYLTYAEQNRVEWEQRGEEICKAMVENVQHLEELSATRRGDRALLSLGENENENNNNTFRSEEFMTDMKDISYVSEKTEETDLNLDRSHRYLDH